MTLLLVYVFAYSNFIMLESVIVVKIPSMGQNTQHAQLGVWLTASVDSVHGQWGKHGGRKALITQSQEAEGKGRSRNASLPFHVTLPGPNSECDVGGHRSKP